MIELLLKNKKRLFNHYNRPSNKKNCKYRRKFGCGESEVSRISTSSIEDKGTR